MKTCGCGLAACGGRPVCETAHPNFDVEAEEWMCAWLGEIAVERRPSQAASLAGLLRHSYERGRSSAEVWPTLARRAIAVLADIQRQESSTAARIAEVLAEHEGWTREAVKRTAARLEERERQNHA